MPDGATSVSDEAASASSEAALGGTSPAPSAAALSAPPQAAIAALRTHFGYDSFRPGQAEVVAAVLGGRDVLAVMPTGAGKSICYQVPAIVRDGVALVVSPLVSLMKDQVQALRETGIAAAFLNSALPVHEHADIMRRALDGAFDLLYVAPERTAYRSGDKISAHRTCASHNSPPCCPRGRPSSP